MLKNLMIAAMLTAISVATAGYMMDRASATEDGPTAKDVKVALHKTGISPGTTVQLGTKTYVLENITVARTGPGAFVVAFTTK